VPGTHQPTRHADGLKHSRTYPLYYYPPTFLERLMLRTGFGGVGKCLVCGALSWWRIESDDLRETGFCRNCASVNRYRALAYVVCKTLNVELDLNLRSLRDLALLDGLSVYNTEAHSAVHIELRRMRNYVCSEFLGSHLAASDYLSHVMHQDLMDLSFPDNSFDLVLSADVFEHLPDPYKAHREIFRVLKTGGRHVFTVPFDQAQYLDDLRAVVDEDGTTQLLRPPVYHRDRFGTNDGRLVYSFFSIEMLSRLRRLGFRTHMYRVRHPFYGIFGDNVTVFEAIKWDPVMELPSDDWFHGRHSELWDDPTP
jgi:SAM-dependent methyltransferase